MFILFHTEDSENRNTVDFSPFRLLRLILIVLRSKNVHIISYWRQWKEEYCRFFAVFVYWGTFIVLRSKNFHIISYWRQWKQEYCRFLFFFFFPLLYSFLYPWRKNCSYIVQKEHNNKYAQAKIVRIKVYFIEFNFRNNTFMCTACPRSLVFLDIWY